VAIVDRPGSTLRSTSAKALQRFAHAQFEEQDAKLLATARPPAFVYLHGPRDASSSTELRRRAGWPSSDPG
jgi:nicotinate-nucleotide adenylyltransferase